ncbi:MAG TPA: pyridoxal-phosphate dependent enzyme [Candidatus Limnocylindrales bacterium]|nr:pyridoxal-phosphate dependent enzyme [Candidatus Limnocylindrales bacterium]
MSTEHVFNGRWRPLFERFARLGERIPLVELADLPTPVRLLAHLGNAIDVRQLWLKDDGLSSAHYGGNKVRKLELLLAAATARGARTVMTFGYAGSNHATATAVHAARIGLGSISMLLPQENAAYLRKNLLVSASVGAEIHEYPSQVALAAAAALTLVRRRVRDGSMPFVIAPGGSSELGTIGFVNAAFELAAQAGEGLLPLPRRIYAAAGSLGTVVGLGIGFAALALPVRIIGVRVVDERFVNPARAQSLWQKTVRLLRSSDASFPEVGSFADHVELRSEFFGGLYARVTEAGEEARALASAHEGLDLDITYTAKALACLIADARAGRIGDDPVLFWNTVSAAPADSLPAGAAPEDLPRRLQRYFDRTTGSSFAAASGK